MTDMRVLHSDMRVLHKNSSLGTLIIKYFITTVKIFCSPASGTEHNTKCKLKVDRTRILGVYDEPAG